MSLTSLQTFLPVPNDFVPPPNKCDWHIQPQTAFATIMIILVIIGLIGNLLVFSIIVILREYKKSITNWYILQLTLADTLFLLMLPFTAHNELVGTWEFSESLCKFKEAVIFINYYASIYFLVIMSFDRYLAVSNAFSMKKWSEKLRTSIASYCFSIFGWILSVLLCIPLFQKSSVTDCKVCQYTFKTNITFVRNIEDYVVDLNHSHQLLNDYVSRLLQEEGNSLEFGISKPISGIVEEDNCKISLESTEYRMWVYCNFIGAFCLPFLLICFFYGKIIHTITSASQVGNAERQRSYRKRVTFIVLALVTLFGVSWLPWYVEKLAGLSGVNLSREDCRTFNNAVRALSYLNSALNPYFYSFLGAHFRERLMRASNRVGLSSLRSRAAAGSFMKKHKRSTSNSGGSGKNGVKNPSASAQGENQRSGFPNVYENDNQKFSVAQKTERTLV